jgi:ribulose-5-phosphate 4-epimerase/fuculose-1-phosphate aldolase
MKSCRRFNNDKDHDMKSVLSDDLFDLAVACRVIALYGHEDKTLGHLSWRDPGGRGVWIKSAHKGLAEIKSSEDFVLIDMDGKRLAGDAPLHKEWPIHTEIIRSRPEINVVGHTHPFYACLLAATNEDLMGIAHEGCYFNAHVPRYRGTSFLIDTHQLGVDLKNALGDHLIVLMNNHGLTFCGSNLAEACTLAIVFEKACKQQITLKATGYGMIQPDREEIALKARNLSRLGILSGFWDYYKRQLAAYEKANGGLIVI